MSSETLAIRVATRLSRLIIQGHYPPGTKLVEMDLAERFEVSRAPIREALKELERLGLVKKNLRQGTRVIELTPRDVTEIYEIKCTIEGLAAELAAERISNSKLKNLGDIFQRMQDYVKCGDIEEYLNASREFHQCIIEASKNSRLIQTYKALSGQIWWLGTMILTRSDRSKASLRDHKKILDALIARDKKKARKTMGNHVRRGGHKGISIRH